METDPMATSTTFRQEETPNFGYRPVQPSTTPPGGREGKLGDGTDAFRERTGFGAGGAGYGAAAAAGGGGRVGAADNQVPGPEWEGSFGDWAKTSAKGLAGVMNPVVGAKLVGDYLYKDYKAQTGTGAGTGYTQGFSSGGKDYPGIPEGSTGPAKSVSGLSGLEAEAFGGISGGGFSGGEVGGGGAGGSGGGSKGESPSDASGTPFAKGGMVGEMREMPGYMHGGPVAAQGTRYMDGGQVMGPGDGNDDAIRARLSNGEFVIQAEAAQILGPEILRALNDPQFAREFAMMVQHEMTMKNGGMNQGPDPSMGTAPPMPQQGQMANATPPARGGALSRIY